MLRTEQVSVHDKPCKGCNYSFSRFFSASCKIYCLNRSCTRPLPLLFLLLLPLPHPLSLVTLLFFFGLSLSESRSLFFILLIPLALSPLFLVLLLLLRLESLKLFGLLQLPLPLSLTLLARLFLTPPRHHWANAAPPTVTPLLPRRRLNSQDPAKQF